MKSEKSMSPTRLALVLWARQKRQGFASFVRGIPGFAGIFLQVLSVLLGLPLFFTLCVFIGTLHGWAVGHWLWGAGFWFDPEAPVPVVSVLTWLNHSMGSQPWLWAMGTALSGLGGMGWLRWQWVKAGRDIQHVPFFRVLLPGLVLTATGFGWVLFLACLGFGLVVAFGMVKALQALRRAALGLPAHLRRRRDAILESSPEGMAALEKARLEAASPATSHVHPKSRL